ncbi:MAG: hypothetical protein D6790_11150, partial [Caldilineae bacterium]
MEAPQFVLRHPAHGRVHFRGQGRDPLPVDPVRAPAQGQHPHQGRCLRQVVRREDLLFAPGAQPGPQGTELRVQEQGVVDDAHQMIPLVTAHAAFEIDGHELAEGVIARLRALNALPRAIDLAHVVDVSVGLDDLADGFGHVQRTSYALATRGRPVYDGIAPIIPDPHSGENVMSQSQDRVRLGLIGAGRIGRIHAEQLTRRVDHAELVTVYDVFSQAARQAAHDFAIPQVAPSLEAMLNDSSLDGVVICSSTDTHAEIMVQAAQAGKHIFCEKPIALDLAEVDRALAA